MKIQLLAHFCVPVLFRTNNNSLFLMLDLIVCYFPDAT